MSDVPTKQDIALGIYKSGLLNFGEFTFKSGIKSPMYMNLRNLGSYPEFLQKVALVFQDMMKDSTYELVAGIPYGAIPIMCAVSMNTKTPLIFPRKESKEYGMGKDLIGEFKAGQTAALVDDLVTKGDSKVESLVPLTNAGIKVTDIFVLLDYDKGAGELLESQGYTLHRFMTVQEVVDIVKEAGHIDDAMYEKASAFLNQK